MSMVLASNYLVTLKRKVLFGVKDVLKETKRYLQEAKEAAGAASVTANRIADMDAKNRALAEVEVAEQAVRDVERYRSEIEKVIEQIGDKETDSESSVSKVPTPLGVDYYVAMARIYANRADELHRESVTHLNGASVSARAAKDAWRRVEAELNPVPQKETHSAPVPGKDI
ncbi:hypothetical protein DQ04_22681000, partial [Trypanosoma grayi]|uniref:hypothetical protein n=1 Tax=Trypanosoma grayi TaxID=71804 RepID=UPI0004F4A486